MTGASSDKTAAALSGSLLARKGAADASGFVNVPGIKGDDGESHEPEIGGRHIPSPRDARAHPRILIVEDDLLNMALMTELFEEHGYATLQAVNGQEAITMARAKRPDLIVMDIMLTGLSGLEVIARLKGDADLMDIPVIAVSALGRTEEVMIRSAGFDEFLSKPFSVASILLTVSRFLH